MIITFTPNPSLDRTVTLNAPLAPGGVHRIEIDQLQPGGKGINVAFGLQRAGLDTLAIFQAAQGDPLLDLVAEAGLPVRTSPISGRVRTNITLLDSEATTKINEPGEKLSADEIAGVEAALLNAVGSGDTVMLSGSLAPGFEVREYAKLVRKIRHVGAWVGVDTSEAPLLALARELREDESAAPNFLKPNAEELGQLTGRDGRDLEAAAGRGDFAGLREAALDLRERGVSDVLVTLGGAGAMLATAEGVWFCQAPDAPVISTVGAGDCSTAGYLIGRAQGMAGPERLALAVAYGSAAVSLPGTTIPHPNQVEPFLRLARSQPVA
ncbi:1-phosphofructokinase family hexose kinase [Ancrocorticia populi]|uniref:1-phosphofructokinase family hexose kinase n=2 Tax=Ancrocorticia populi TaxID=2175228 RepID=UPI0023524059|nr:1-phosphofructokinase family hexose kinase [Ancrocorticia populi]